MQRRIAYIYNKHFKRSQAAETIAQGFGSAFKRLGDNFCVFDITALRFDFFSGERKKLIDFKPDLIFTSVENINILPLHQIQSCKLVLWGQFFKACNFEDQIVTINKKTKQCLNKYRDRHQILIWSQHSDKINDEYFAGYRDELGLNFMQLLHCTDKGLFVEPQFQTDNDFIWIGNIGHRKDMYMNVLHPLKKESNSFIEITEKNPMSPNVVFQKKMYSRATLAINVHTKAQIDHGILLNERVFSSSWQGGFQVCDNILARQYFTDDELVIVQKPTDFKEVLYHYKKRPEERITMIKRMQAKILNKHLYEHRIQSIEKQFC